jgi:aquaporin Z
MDERWRIFVAEFIGTAVLVLGGVGTAVLAGKHVGFLGIAFAFGLSLLIMAYAIGSISGCHINPAVTMGMWLAKRIPTSVLPYYWVAQVLGAIFGSLLVYGIASSQPGFSAEASGFGANGFGKHSPAFGLLTHGYSWWGAFLGEVVVTAMFVFVVISTGRRRFPAVFTGLAIGLALTVAHLIMIPVDGTSVNPARSIGPALFQHTWALSELWVFILAPLAGGALAAFLWRVYPERVEEEEPEAVLQPMPETEPGIVGAGPPPPA